MRSSGFAANCLNNRGDWGNKLSSNKHPLGANTWGYPEMKKLLQQYHETKCHMCRYGLCLPSSDRYTRKANGLLLSHEHMKSLGLQCPSKRDVHHTCHDTIAGSNKEVGSTSQFAAQHTPAFVQAVMLCDEIQCRLPLMARRTRT